MPYPFNNLGLALKTANENRVNDNTFSNDSALFLNNIEPGNYFLFANIFNSADPAANIKVRFVTSGSGSAFLTNTIANNDAIDFNTQIIFAGNNNLRMGAIYGMLQITTLSNINLQWAQQNVNANASFIYGNSFLKIIKFR